MESQHFERKNKIKLRVVTSTGLNLLCTANRSQKVKELLPHIIKLYQQVKQDQGFLEEDQLTSQPYIKFLRKEEFYIAPSELVGDIFDENDEVFCEIADNSFQAKPQYKILKQQQKKEQPETDKAENNISKTKKIKKKHDKPNQHNKPSQNQNKQKQTSKDQSQDRKKDNNQNQTKKQNKKIIIPLEKKTQGDNSNHSKPIKNLDNETRIQKSTAQLKMPNSTKPNNHTESQNKPHIEGQVSKKVNKNKKKHQKVEESKDQAQKMSQQKDKLQKINLITKPSTSKSHKIQITSQPPLISNDELAKFRMMLKKSASGNEGSNK